MKFRKNQTNESRLNPGYFDSAELKKMGFRQIGSNVRIAKNITIIGQENISIGSDVRIDGYTVVSAGRGEIKIGNFVHIANGCHLVCAGGVELQDFTGLAHGVKIYSASDDYTGMGLTNPTVPQELTAINFGKVILQNHVIVGANSVVLPGVTLGEGSAVGALTLVAQDLPPWGIYSGAPARRIKERSKEILNLEKEIHFR